MKSKLNDIFYKDVIILCLWSFDNESFRWLVKNLSVFSLTINWLKLYDNEWSGQLKPHTRALPCTPTTSSCIRRQQTCLSGFFFQFYLSIVFLLLPLYVKYVASKFVINVNLKRSISVVKQVKQNKKCLFFELKYVFLSSLGREWGTVPTVRGVWSANFCISGVNFKQNFTSSFFVQKYFSQLFSTYCLAL